METDLRKIDASIKKLWADNGTEKKTLKARKGKKAFFFLDGPPYATGEIHVGTALNKIFKDFYIRYYRMQGLDVWCQPGYDCHGVPIENKVEKKLGFKSKQDIENYGVERFNKECEKFATEFISVMNKQFDDLGVWMDWDNPYLTLRNEYMEGAWHTFKVGFDKGLLYKGKYPVHVCPRCATAVAYNEIEYANVSDTAVFVKFEVKDKPGEFLVIWTTTPWTLPSNTGIMAHPKFDYVKARVGNETWVLAKDLAKPLFDKLGKPLEIISTIKGSELAGVRYKHPLADLLPLQKGIDARVVLSEQFVTLETGTGLVHCAPGHGLEDFKVGNENKLAMLTPVDLNGKFTREVGEKWAGRFVKDADTEIIAELNARGALVFEEKITHDYPMCWRCGSALLFLSVPQWFFRVSQIREKLIEENKKVKWEPAWAGKRFEDWLMSLADWPISRQRYWDIPLPIWTCEKCEKVRVVGNYDELPKKLADYHRPFIDEVVLRCECGGDMHRIPDVLDVWFDSGVCSWASLGFPRDKKLFEKMWPPKLIIEGPDQFRGWWNSQMICSAITFDKTPFLNVILHGFVLDAKSRSKMSKSKGGVSPDEFCAKYGRDVLRHYYLSKEHSEDFGFEWSEVEDANRFFNILLNSASFVQTYCGARPEKPKLAGLKPEDKWVLSRINSLVQKNEELMQSMRGYKALQEIENFVVNDFSKAYIKYVRDRVRLGYEGKDKAAAHATLSYVLSRIARLLAPACPFVSEAIYQEAIKDKEESIHLTLLPKPDAKKINKDLEEQMQLAQAVIEAASSLRNSVGIKLRQPLRTLIIETKDAKVRAAVKKFSKLIADQVNVKKAVAGAGKKEFAVLELPNARVFLDKRIDEELRKEGMTREIIRHVQQMRKEAGLFEKDQTILTIDAPNAFVQLLDRERIAKQTNAKELKFAPVQSKAKALEIENFHINVLLEKN